MRVGTRNIRKDLIIHSLSLRRRTVRGKSQRGKGKGVASVLFTAPERHQTPTETIDAVCCTHDLFGRVALCLVWGLSVVAMWHVIPLPPPPFLPSLFPSLFPSLLLLPKGIKV